jgi:hypothetical protein
LLAQTLSAATVGRYGVFERSFTARSVSSNPYRDLAAEAVLVGLDGKATSPVPLFWDGGSTWKLRFSPNQTGLWKWTVRSADAGLNNQSGVFECVASPLKGGLQPMVGAPHHFQRQNGERIWFLGDTAWALLSDNEPKLHHRAAVEQYLKNRAGQGFTAVHLSLLSETAWGNAGGAPWTDLAAEQINPLYWQEADQRIAFANAQGLTVGLTLAWARKRTTAGELYAWGRFPSLEARLRYARYIAARYSAYNVYFLVSGEWHGEVGTRKSTQAAIRAEFVAIGDALKAADPHGRMIGIHPMDDEGSTREFNDTAWMSFGDYQQNYSALHQRVLDSRRFNKPVVNGEYAYFLRDRGGHGVVDKPHSYTVDDIRHATWDIVMGGAYVVTGFGSTYMGGNRHPTPFLPDDPKNEPWVEQIGLVKTFFTSLDWWKLAPHDELLLCPTPRSADRSGLVEVNGRQQERVQAPATTYWCLAEPGREYVIYTRCLKAPLTVELGEAPTRLQATQFDPRSGQRTELSPATVRHEFQFLPPDEQDWLLVLEQTRSPNHEPRHS